MQVAKWGNSLAVRLPARVVKLLELREGDEIEIRVSGPREMEVSRAPTRDELMARLSCFQGALPEGFVWDREEAQR